MPGFSDLALHLAPYAGFPACWEALALAQVVFREMDDNNSRKAA